MADLNLSREFPVPVDTLFAFLTTPEGTAQWWGPEGYSVTHAELDFTKLGAWTVSMRNAEGTALKISGQVTHVSPPVSLGFTWAWHDPEDIRGEESHVTFTVEATQNGSRLIVDHRDLPDQASADGHVRGWTSTLNRLQAAVSIP
ncbi:hypothetical protein ACMU_02540 [Actibacterium mucosum KCTC 23349]|uniref:Activator of Hsp90 ATPase homologue 1/2-like C-terminal domain-containing protein n=1 Tax=Actibacterium mucosum KCTC 23349 TaxID=1454373 RepID=A0A037ZLX2_9RHOB|nr:SRPBCC domain-containing protein [Actibacterium mucosum]KAJ57401.1 hypothetical protein ACMU_02540 [Actibacterium mucosum KCTC 23349]